MMYEDLHGIIDMYYNAIHNFVGCPCDYKLDFEVAPKHLGQLADMMTEWKGAIAEGLSLSDADIAAIVLKHDKDLKLQA